MIDVVMLSNCASPELYQMTKRAVDSLGGGLNLIWVEGNIEIKEATVYQRSTPFNYNDCLLQAQPFFNKTNKAVFIINNDIICHPNSVEMLYASLSYYDSVSPACPIRHGNCTGIRLQARVAQELCGWAIMMRKAVIEKIVWSNMWPIELPFWYQDTYYGDLLKKHGFRHAQICDAKITHLESKSHDLLEDRDLYTKKQVVNYEQVRRKL